MTHRIFSSVLPACAAIVLATGSMRSDAADWPTYRGDASRSGFTAEPVPNQLRLRWQHHASRPPQPAWPTSARIDFDLVFQPVIVGDLVLFGSSADDQVFALDAATGKVRWRFFTDGPVRFAPAVWQDRVFVVSDDGFLYALAVADGRLLWKHRAVPESTRVFGNERLISRWPARGGPVVWNGAVYYTAGIWPSDGVHVQSLNAATGALIWQNSETGRMRMSQPHGGAEALSGVAPQGYLLATADDLIVPTGRAVPAMFDRVDGKLRYYHLQKNQHRGGTRVLVTENSFLNAGCLFDAASGEMTSQLGLGSAAAVPGGLVRADGRSLISYRWRDVEKIDRKGQSQKVRSLEQDKIIPVDREALEVIVAGSDAVVGCDGEVTAIDYNAQRNQWWRHEVDGRVLGLAAANGRLVATTDKGFVYLFDGSPEPLPSPIVETTSEAEDAGAAKQARSMLSSCGVSAGYAVQLGAENAQFALALARRSSLSVMVIEPDPARVASLREEVAAAGMYGSRITVHQASTGATSFPKGFAELVFAGSEKNETPDVLSEMRRLRRPYSGVAYLHRDGHGFAEKGAPPPGAGSWTHQNGNAANTLCSDDEIVKGQLSMRWFRDVDFEIANRHGQGPAPLVANGFMVVSGVNGLCCVDAFSGRTLWQYEIRGFLADYDGIHHDVGVGDTGGPFCIGGDSVYVKTGARCLRIDLRSGKVVREYATPVAKDAADRNWGYLAWENGILFGSVENQAHNVSARYQLTSLRTESVLLFALDPDSGAVKWQYQPKGSIRHNAIAVAGDRLYLIDRPLIDADRVMNPRREARPVKRMSPSEVPNGTLLALDVQSGRQVWRNEDDIWGTEVAVSARQGTLLMNYKAVRHNFFEIPSEAGGRLGAFDIKTGAKLWEQQVKYETRPLINDDKIYAQGGAWDLKTGSPLPWELKRSYGCGQISSSRNMLLFRSATLGYLDLSRDAGTENYGGIRPSCWINAIPASGLVLVPDGSAKCQCSYQMQTWFALEGQ